MYPQVIKVFTSYGLNLIENIGNSPVFQNAKLLSYPHLNTYRLNVLSTAIDTRFSPFGENAKWSIPPQWDVYSIAKVSKV